MRLYVGWQWLFAASHKLFGANSVGWISVLTQGGPQLGQFESGLVAQLASIELSALTGGLATLLLVAAVAATPWVRRYELPPPPAPERLTPAGAA